MVFLVYVLKSESTGKIYIGHTSDFERRIRQHNDSQCNLTLYTKRNPGPWILVYKEEYHTRVLAIHREKFFKSGHGRKWLRDNVPAEL